MNGSHGKLAVVSRLAWAAASTGAVVFAAAMSAAAGEPLEETSERSQDVISEAEPEEASERERPNVRGRTRAAHRELRAKAWGHIREREYDAAITVLERLQTRESPEDAAFTHQALAAAYNFKRDFERVLHHQRQIVEQPGSLPPRSVRAALMSAGYLSFQQRRFEDAVRYMEAWKEDERDPPARFFAMLARAYAELGDRPKSIENADAVVHAAEAEGVQVPQWIEELRSDGHRGRGEAGRDAIGDGQR